MDLNEDSLHLQHLNHPLVQQNRGDVNGLNTSNSTNGTDMSTGKGRWRGRRGRRGKKGMKMRCKNSFDTDVECINAYYTKLDDNNEIEW